ncbi:MAG: sugar phosphate nucleotidyltransferase [Cyclobacteriaceae bacterium]|nr:sugar phosphate nucleotidyltransferase [Cyclobacteriaceae bacterium]MDW8331853.1 sugar phosphate nucleotidyltransferase [Cyclobacteriaceae bacterium]
MSAPSKITLLVLAAGMGSRYGGIKQIDGFGPNGETIMDYSLYDALRAGFNKVVFIVRDEIKEIIREKFGERLAGKAEVEYVVQTLDKHVPPPYRNPQRPKPWGTGHAMLCARDVINEPFAVINADDFYGPTAFENVVKFFRTNTEGDNVHALVGYTLKYVLSEHGAVSRGVGEEDDKGYLTGVVERTNVARINGKIIAREKDGDVELSPEAKTSMNFWGFYPSIFPITERLFHAFLKENYQNPKAEFFIPILANTLVKSGEGKIKIISGGDTWFGVTYPEDKPEVIAKIRAQIDAGKYPEKLW